MKKLTAIVGLLSLILSFGCMINGFVQSLQLVVDQWGVPMGGVAVLMFPVTLSFMPWYAGLVLDNWWILAFSWGGFLGLAISQGIIAAGASE